MACFEIALHTDKCLCDPALQVMLSVVAFRNMLLVVLLVLLPIGPFSGQFLKADMSISCDSSAHKVYKALAWVLFCLVPVGFPLAVGVIFWLRDRKRMLWIQGAAWCGAGPRGTVRCGTLWCG